MKRAPEPWSLVLAGGAGKRLQSLTTDAHGVSIPKQYWSLDGDKSLLGLALSRARRVAPRSRIATVVAAEHRRWWSSEVTGLFPTNVVVQPRNRGTAAGVLLPLLVILAYDPDATILFLPSDHFVADEPALERAVRQALEQVASNPDALVLLGMEPDELDAEFGWIVPMPRSTGEASPVDCFVEKPPAAVARELMQRGGLWNSFIFVARGSAVLALYERRLPQVLAAVKTALEQQRQDPGDSRALEMAYEQLDSADFCRDLLQGSEQALQAIPVPPCGWSDLGTEERLSRCIERLPRSTTEWSWTSAHADAHPTGPELIEEAVVVAR